MTQTMTIEYNPLSTVAQHIVALLRVSNEIKVVDAPVVKTKDDAFSRNFATAMKHAKEYKEGKREFRSVDDLIAEL